MRRLISTEAVVEELGDIDKVARILGAKYSATANWKYRNRFPANTYLVLIAALRKRGCTAPESLWGMRKPQEAAE
jgi:hypothetical protein